MQQLDPEPYSDAEDRAVADGLQGVPLNQAGEVGYFGLSGSNSMDGRSVIAFFNLEREPFLEYDLTKLIHGLAVPDRPVLGLINSLASLGAMGGPQGGPPPLRVLDQIGEFFTVENIEPENPVIPPSVKTLLITDLTRLGPDALHAVDSFVHDGGRALVFTDPFIETVQAFRGPDEGATAAAGRRRSCCGHGASNFCRIRWQATLTRLGASPPANAAVLAPMSPGCRWVRATSIPAIR